MTTKFVGEAEKWDASRFKTFTASDEIQNLDPSKLPTPFRKASYNDDIVLEHFQSSSRHYAGKQRRGVADERLTCLSQEEHIENAINSPFFLPLSTPLPEAFREAALFIRDSDPALVSLFWDEQLARLDGLIKASAPIQNA